MTTFDDARKAQQGIRRRTLLKAAAWSVPVMSLAVATPLAAASQALCDTDFAVQFTVGPGGASPATLTATSPDSAEVYTVQISSALGANTTTTQAGASYNFSQNGSGWNGGTDPIGNTDYVFTGFGPAGALVLSQRVQGSNAPIGPGADSQQLTFTFTSSLGTVVNPTDFQIQVFDISSATANIWRSNYWDTVGFSVAPDTITHAPLRDPGLGAGTLADPFRRTGGNIQTGQGPFVDTFQFASFPSSSTMTYSQAAGRQGWHFIAISGISFTAPAGC